MTLFLHNYLDWKWGIFCETNYPENVTSSLCIMKILLPYLKEMNTAVLSCKFFIKKKPYLSLFFVILFLKFFLIFLWKRSSTYSFVMFLWFISMLTVSFENWYYKFFICHVLSHIFYNHVLSCRFTCQEPITLRQIYISFRYVSRFSIA